ncbi:MAG: phytoene desaturase family protein [Bacteriovoracaceae bacterium]|nr:phytoene desaturase family protein [Bacteriovoracaceae bacterium]
MNKAVVIGSGFAGLASAVRLIKKGYEVTILEAREDIGGRAAVFKKDGFTFDAGPTVITAPYLLSELFELLGEDAKDFYELMAIDPFYRIIFNDGSQFDYVGDNDRIIENVRALSPADVDGYRLLAKHSEAIFDVGYTQLADEPFNTISSMMRAIPDMVRLQNYRSVYGLVSKYIKDERLRMAFSFEPLLVGGNPTTITSIYLLIHWLERKWGVYFAKGGTGAIVDALRKLLLMKGAKIYTQSSVKKIEIERGSVKRVFTTDERIFPCDIVVSNADPVRVYRDMIDAKHRSKHSDFRLGLKQHSMSLFVAYFGTKKLYPGLAHHTILMGPRYKGLLNDIFSKKILADDFSLYLHAPTRTDSSLAPDGHECFYVLSPVPNKVGKTNWRDEEQRYKDKIYGWLEKNHLPCLTENMTVDFSVTPDYFETQLQSEKGAAFGLEPSLSQSAYFRFHNQSEDIKGLYFVGANTHPGAGVPGVLNSAKVLEKMVPDLKNKFTNVGFAIPKKFSSSERESSLE